MPAPKIILITGCSSGFGLHMAARLASSGHTVIATMRDLYKSNVLLEEVKKRGATVELLQLDVTDKKSIDVCIQEVGNKYGRIDVLINNAGYGLGGFFEDCTDEQIRAQFDTNFFGVQNVTRAVIPFMRQRRQGKIINISSISGFTASACFGAYAASKWALEGFSESLREELKFFGIDVLLIEPGVYNTLVFKVNAKRAENFDNPESPYFPISQFLKDQIMSYVNKCTRDPEEVAALAERLINSANPPFRNIPDLLGKLRWCLLKILPFKLFSWIHRKVFFAGLNWEEKRL